MAMREGQSDLVRRCLSLPQSIESTHQKRSDRRKSPWLVGNNAMLSISDHFVAMEASLKLKISYPMWRLRCRWVDLVPSLWSKRVHRSSPSCQISLASHTRGNIQRSGTWGHVLAIAENVAKETDDLVLTAVHPYLSPISMSGASPIDCLLCNSSSLSLNTEPLLSL